MFSRLLDRRSNWVMVGYSILIGCVIALIERSGAPDPVIWCFIGYANYLLGCRVTFLRFEEDGRLTRHK